MQTAMKINIDEMRLYFIDGKKSFIEYRKTWIKDYFKIFNSQLIQVFYYLLSQLLIYLIKSLALSSLFQ